MNRHDSEGDNMAKGCQNSDAALPKMQVDAGVGKGSHRVTREGGKKDERHGRIVQMVVFFELRVMSILRFQKRRGPGTILRKGVGPTTSVSLYYSERGLNIWMKRTPIAASVIPAIKKDMNPNINRGIFPLG